VRILQGVRAASVSLGGIRRVTPSSYLVSIPQTWRKRTGEGGEESGNAEKQGGESGEGRNGKRGNTGWRELDEGRGAR